MRGDSCSCRLNVRLIGAALLLATAGCSTWSLEYRGENQFKFPYGDVQPIVFGLLDERADLANPTDAWIGFMRGQYNVPYPVSTASGRPLSVDLREALVAQMLRDGLHVQWVEVLPKTSRLEAGQQIVAKSSASHSVGLLLILNKWQTDNDSEAPTLTYDVLLQVIDTSGRVIATSNAAGSKPLSIDNLTYGRAASNLNPQIVKAAAKALDVSIAELMTALVSAPDVKLALTGQVPDVAPVQPAAALAPPPVAPAPASAPASAPPTKPAAAPAKTGCSVDQILKMKEAGLNDSQVRAACDAKP